MKVDDVKIGQRVRFAGQRWEVADRYYTESSALYSTTPVRRVCLVLTDGIRTVREFRAPEWEIEAA